jgi:F0F1-type ATP synthase membrane subunit a
MGKDKVRDAIEILDQEVNKPKKDKRVYSLFIMLVPSLLIAMARSIAETTVALGFQILLILLQLVVFKTLLDSYWGEEAR